MKVASSVLLFSPLAAALFWDGPAPTPVGEGLKNRIDGWTPKPTTAPARGLELLRRQSSQEPLLMASDSVCGYISGSSDLAFSYVYSSCTCAFSTADTAGEFGLMSCCFDHSCLPAPTTCYDYNDYWTSSACDDNCLQDPYVIACTATSAPYCAGIEFDNPDVRGLFCDNLNITTWRTAYTTYLGEQGAESWSTWESGITTSSSSSSSTPVSTPTTSTLPLFSTTSTSSSSTATATGGGGGGGSSTPVGAIVGGVVGGVVAVCLVVAATIIYLKRSKRKAAAAAASTGMTQQPAAGPGGPGGQYAYNGQPGQEYFGAGAAAEQEKNAYQAQSSPVSGYTSPMTPGAPFNGSQPTSPGSPATTFAATHNTARDSQMSGIVSELSSEPVMSHRSGPVPSHEPIYEMGSSN